MAAAIARCRQTGVVAMTLANAHHIGRVGAYGEMASGGRPRVAALRQRDRPSRGWWRRSAAPTRASSPIPVCIALPGTDRQPPLLLDMATSAVAMGKVRVARNEGHEVEPGILIDQAGKPTAIPT